jgi:molecular chaperone GrpE
MIQEETQEEEEEAEGGQLDISDEMETALREAEESYDERKTEPGGDPAGAGPESADKMTIEVLSQELQALKTEYEARDAELAEAQDKLSRLQAEFENFRKRTLKERQDSFQYGHQNLVKDLLSSVDNLERALEHGEQSGDGDFQSLLQGVELVHRELLGALDKHGVVAIDAQGEVFDPAIHEAMAQVPTADVPPNSIVQVLQKGYQLRDRMIRPTRVIVAKAEPE